LKRSDRKFFRFDPRSAVGKLALAGGVMSAKWAFLVLAIGLAMTLVNLAILAGQISTPASARGPSNASKLLDDDNFTDGLTKIIRKTVRDYCTVGKRDGIDC
jgi:hypothetical protein